VNKSLVKVDDMVTIVGLHRSTAYVDAAYCYRSSSVVCWSAGMPVHQSFSLSQL